MVVVVVDLWAILQLLKESYLDIMNCISEREKMKTKIL
jgi:hypothetical protein